MVAELGGVVVGAVVVVVVVVARGGILGTPVPYVVAFLAADFANVLVGLEGCRI